MKFKMRLILYQRVDPEKEQAIDKYQYNKAKIITVTRVRKMTFAPSKIIFQMRAPKARAQFLKAF